MTKPRILILSLAAATWVSSCATKVNLAEHRYPNEQFSIGLPQGWQIDPASTPDVLTLRLVPNQKVVECSDAAPGKALNVEVTATRFKEAQTAAKLAELEGKKLKAYTIGSSSSGGWNWGYTSYYIEPGPGSGRSLFVVFPERSYAIRCVSYSSKDSCRALTEDVCNTIASSISYLKPGS